MASLILAAGILTYDKVKTTRDKRRARKEDTVARFSELEKDNAERMARLRPASYQPPAEPYPEAHTRNMGERTLRVEADPFRDEVEGERRGSLEREESGSEEGDRVVGDRAVGDRPPEYEAQVREEKGRGRRLKGVFRRKEKGEKDDGVVR